MKTAVAVIALAGSAAAFTTSPASRSTTQLAESKADLEAMAGKLNPVVKVRKNVLMLL
jgi:hypothetical protein